MSVSEVVLILACEFLANSEALRRKSLVKSEAPMFRVSKDVWICSWSGGPAPKV